MGLFQFGTDSIHGRTVVFASCTARPFLISNLALVSWFGTERVLEEDKEINKIGNGKAGKKLYEAQGLPASSS